MVDAIQEPRVVKNDLVYIGLNVSGLPHLIDKLSYLLIDVGVLVLGVDGDVVDRLCIINQMSFSCLNYLITCFIISLNYIYILIRYIRLI